MPDGTRSEPGVEIRVSTPPDVRVDIDSGGFHWEHAPGPPPDRLRTTSLWKAVLANLAGRDTLLRQAGTELASWMLGPEAGRFLDDHVSSWACDGRPRRIELHVGPALSEWPWEAMYLDKAGFLGANRSLTVVRVAQSRSQEPHPAGGPLAVEVVGVQLDPLVGDPVDALATALEAERVRSEIERAGGGRSFSVRVDPRGTWDAIVERVEHEGPPHVFHFAGHGTPDGRGLVFRGQAGGPEPVDAERIAVLLGQRVRSRATLLAFLNACSSASEVRGPDHPFGGVGPLLVRHGIPAVVGLQTPVADAESRLLAETFYRGIGNGDSVDCALQAARRALYLRGAAGLGWAFLTLTVHGTPGPLCRPPVAGPGLGGSRLLLDFAHEEQRNCLTRFLKRKLPLVIVIHGEEGSGHRHVVTRVQHDLERAGNVLWRPVSTMRFHAAGEPLVARSQLAGGIARALGVSDQGTRQQLEHQLAWVLADRCSDGRAVVLDLLDVVKPTMKAQADALVELVQELWADLLEDAARIRDALPVFLLLPVAYPRPLREDHPRSEAARRQDQWTREAIHRIEEQRRLRGRVRVEVLPELAPITGGYIAQFLEDVLEVPPDRADALAADIGASGDNEAILGRMRDLLEDWGGME